MKKYNKEDLFRYEGKKCNSLLIQLKYLLFVPGFQYSYCLRHTQHASNVISRFFWNAMLRLMMYHSGIQIPYQTKIASGLKFSHWGTLVINPAAKIGRNFSIAFGCTVGNAQGKRNGVPIIGNNVVMQTNSVISGGVTIGNNVLIAPGAFVNFDVPDNSIVIGNPGKIISQKSSPTAKYIVYPVEDFNRIELL